MLVIEIPNGQGRGSMYKRHCYRNSYFRPYGQTNLLKMILAIGRVESGIIQKDTQQYVHPLCPTVSRWIQVHCSLWNQLKEEKNYICIQIYIELELGRFMGDGDQKHPRAGMNVVCTVYVPKYEVCLIAFPQMEISYEQDISSFLTYWSYPNCVCINLKK